MGSNLKLEEQPRRGVSRPAFWRIFEIRKLVMSGRYPNCHTLAEEIEVSQKTIQRDISFMRDQLDMPIVYDPVRHGYYFDGDVNDVAPLKLSRQDLVALFLARCALEPIRGTRLQKVLSESFSKIVDACSGSVSFQWYELEKIFTVKNAGVLEADIHLFGDLFEAVQEQREVSFSYLKLTARKPEMRRVQPYHVGQVDHGWYLIGFDLDRQSMRTFALQRISEVKIMKSTFVRDTKFDPVDFLGSAFGVWSYHDKEDKEYEVVIEFNDYAARIVAERQWHPTQRIRNLDDGKVEFRVTLSGLEEVTRWILSWGSKAKVIGPIELQARVCNELQQMASNYS